MDEDASDSIIERQDPDPDADGDGGGGGVGGDDVQVLEWMDGLPSSDDLIPLSQLLVSPELASAFSIPAPGIQTLLDVNQAVQMTISNFTRSQNQSSSPPSSSPHKRFPVATVFSEAENCKVACSSDHGDGSSAGIVTAAFKGDSSSIHEETFVEDNSGRMLKRTRLVWTPQLHKRFVDVVAHLGIKNAVPKTIMQLMNVDGLTRENVASHLQKYRLYLKRVQGLSNEGPSSSDLLFASTPVPQSLQEQQIPLPMPYTVPTMIPMPVYNMTGHHAHGLVPVNNHQSGPLYNGYDLHHSFAPNDWLGGSKFAPIISSPHVTPNDK